MATVFTPIGDVLESLHPDQLLRSPALANPAPDNPDRLLGDSAPTNQQIIDTAKAFYQAHQPVVDATTLNTKAVAQTQPGYVAQMNSYDWPSQRLTEAELQTTGDSIFADDWGVGGIWDPTLNTVKADQMFTTIGVGINADVQFFIGGAGGLGCAWDIVRREGPRGYGFATGEIGARITDSINIQCLILNQLPSDLNYDIYGLKVSIDIGISISFSVFCTNLGSLQVLGYGIGAGLGLGGGATVFGGHIWNFG